jgi:hypothetical protein
MIAQAPHTGQYYLADSRCIHNLLTGYLHGELTENWIHNIALYQYGRHDYLALRNHYAGEGDLTHHIANAKRIQVTLHYKREHALPFSKFLDSLQKMFTIFSEEKEPLTKRAEVDELLTKVQNPALTAAIAQLRFQLNTEGITFTVAANHLNAAVSQTPITRWPVKSSLLLPPIAKAEAAIPGDVELVDYYSPADWNKLSYEERDKI